MPSGVRVQVPLSAPIYKARQAHKYIQADWSGGTATSDREPMNIVKLCDWVERAQSTKQQLQARRIETKLAIVRPGLYNVRRLRTRDGAAW